jgi:hypothetical protein
MKPVMWLLVVLLVVSGLMGVDCFGTEQEAGIIIGKVVDDGTRTPISPVRIELFSEQKQRIVASVATKEDGSFELLQVPFGTYRMVLSCNGYLDGAVPAIEVSRGNDRVLMDDIALRENVVLLDEVTVTQQKLQGVEEIDRTVFAVTDDIRNASSSGLDLLRYIPSVTVDFLENVTLQGKSDIQLYVDGAQRSKEFVAQLSPDAIERVELVTNPSVKYDADISGVISIVLKKDQREGVHGYVKVPFSNPDKIMSEPAASIDYTVGNVRLFIGDRLYYQRWDAEESVSSRWQTDSGVEGRLEKTEAYGYKWQRNFLDYGVDWFINDRTALNFEGEWIMWEYDPRDEVAESSIFTDGVMDQYYTTNSDSERRNDDYYFSLFFRQELEQEGCEFTVEAYFNQEDYEYDYEYEKLFYNLQDLSEIVDTVSGVEATDDIRKTAQLKVDHAFLTGGVKNEVGFKSFNGRAESESSETILGGTVESSLDQYDYEEWRHRVYYNAMGEWGQVAWQFGGSGEYERVEIEGGDAVEHLFFLPQVSLSRNFEEKGSLKLSYKRNIERPMTYQLRPFETAIDSQHVQAGNPDLDPEKEDVLKLSYSKNFNSSYIGPELYFNYTGNTIQEVTYLRDDGVFVSTQENIGRELEYGLGIGMSLQLRDFWRLNGYMSGFNREVSSRSSVDDYHGEKATYLVSLQNVFTLPKDFSFTVVSFYQSPSLSYRQEYSPDPWIILDLGKKITDRLEMSVVWFPFAVNGSESVTNYPDFYEKSSRDIDTQNWFVVSFKYTFDYGAEARAIDRSSDYEMVDDEGAI